MDQTLNIEPFRGVLMSPKPRFDVSYLPVEILMSIFILCLPPKPKGRLRSWGLMKHAPLLLTSICKRWYQIVVNTPELWEVLHAYTPRSFPGVDAGVERWFERAKDRSLILDFPVWSCSNLGPNMPWERLTSLILESRNEDTPALLYAHEILLPCQNLVTCILYGMRRYGDRSPVPPPVPHSCLQFLQTLYIQLTPHDGAGSISELFEWVDFSALKDLAVEATGIPSLDPRFFTRLSEAYIRSSFWLESLHIHDIVFPIHTIHVFLMYTNLLKKLHILSRIHEEHMLAFLLQTLAYVPSITHNILPNLEELIICDCYNSRQSRDIWDRMALACLESRRWKEGKYPHTQKGLRPLRTAWIRWENMRDIDQTLYDMDIAGKQRFDRICESGMNIIMSSFGLNKRN